jgi:acyl carrier protein
MTIATDSAIQDRHRAIADWLATNIGALTGVPASAVAHDAPFARLGLDSAAAVALAGDLEEWLGTSLDPTMLYDYTTISTLSAYLARSSESGAAR